MYQDHPIEAGPPEGELVAEATPQAPAPPVGWWGRLLPRGKCYEPRWQWHTLLHTYGSGQGILLAWLGLLALAVLVFLVLIAVGAHHPGRERHRRGADHRAAFWQQGPPPSSHGLQHPPERRPYERR